RTASPALSLPDALPIFAAALEQELAVLVVQLGGEGPRAHPGGVGLDDADGAGDLVRRDAGADARAAGGRVRGGHERVGAVVHVEDRKSTRLNSSHVKIT